MRKFIIVFYLFLSAKVTFAKEFWLEESKNGKNCTYNDPCSSFRVVHEKLQHNESNFIFILKNINAISQLQWSFSNGLTISGAINDSASIIFSQVFSVTKLHESLFDNEKNGVINFVYVRFSLPNTFSELLENKPYSLIGSKGKELRIEESIFDASLISEQVVYSFVTVSDGSLFVISTFFETRQTVSLDASAFIIKEFTSNVYFGNCTFQNFNLRGNNTAICVNLPEDSSTFVQIEGCTFKNIQSTENSKLFGRGAIAFLSKGSEAKLHFSGKNATTEFSNCVSPTTGGAITVLAPFSVGLSFQNNNSRMLKFRDNQALLGNDMFLLVKDAKDLSTILFSKELNNGKIDESIAIYDKTQLSAAVDLNLLTILLGSESDVVYLDYESQFSSGIKNLAQNTYKSFDDAISKCKCMKSATLAVSKKAVGSQLKLEDQNCRFCFHITITSAFNLINNRVFNSNFIGIEDYCEIVYKPETVIEQEGDALFQSVHSLAVCGVSLHLPSSFVGNHSPFSIFYVCEGGKKSYDAKESAESSSTTTSSSSSSSSSILSLLLSYVEFVLQPSDKTIAFQLIVAKEGSISLNYVSVNNVGSFAYHFAFSLFEIDLSHVNIDESLHDVYVCNVDVAERSVFEFYANKETELANWQLQTSQSIYSFNSSSSQSNKYVLSSLTQHSFSSDFLEPHAIHLELCNFTFINTSSKTGAGCVTVNISTKSHLILFVSSLGIYNCISCSTSPLHNSSLYGIDDSSSSISSNSPSHPYFAFSPSHGAFTVITSAPSFIRLRNISTEKCTASKGKGGVFHLVGIASLIASQLSFVDASALKGGAMFVEIHECIPLSHGNSSDIQDPLLVKLKEANFSLFEIYSSKEILNDSYNIDDDTKLIQFVNVHFENCSASISDEDKGTDVYCIDRRLHYQKESFFFCSSSTSDVTSGLFLKTNEESEHKNWISTSLFKCSETENVFSKFFVNGENDVSAKKILQTSSFSSGASLRDSNVRILNDILLKTVSVDPIYGRDESHGDVKGCEDDQTVACKTIQKALMLLSRNGMVKCVGGTYDSEDIPIQLIEQQKVTIEREEGSQEFCDLHLMNDLKNQIYISVTSSSSFLLHNFRVISDTSFLHMLKTTLFAVSDSGELFLTSCTVTRQLNSPTVDRFCEPLFRVSGGTLALSTTTVENINMEVYPLIYFPSDRTGAAIILSDCVFTDILLDCTIGGEPSLMQIVSTEDKNVDLSVTRCKIRRCTSEVATKGGAISIYCYNPEMKLSLEGRLSISFCRGSFRGTFGGAIYMDISKHIPKYSQKDANLELTGNTAQNGNSLFIRAKNLEEIIKQPQFAPGFFSKVPGEVIGMDENQFIDTGIDLFALLATTKLETVFLDPLGMDKRYCGILFHPCKTFDEALKHVTPPDAKIILRSPKMLSASPTTFDISLSIFYETTGFESPFFSIELNQIFEENEGYFNMDSQSFSLQFVDFSLSKGNLVNGGGKYPVALFKTTNTGKLELHGSFVNYTSKNISTCVLRMEGGRARLSSISMVESTYLFNVSPFYITSGSFTISNSYFSNFILSGADGIVCVPKAAVEDTGNERAISIFNSIILNCSLDSNFNGIGTFVSCVGECQMTISASLFSNCRAYGKEGSGGALFFSDFKALSIIGSKSSHVVFSNCRAKQSGGALYISIKEEKPISKTMILEYVEINDCQSKYGGGVFIMMDFSSINCSFIISFHKCVVVSGGQGHDIFMRHTGNEDISKEQSPFARSITSNLEEGRVYYKGKEIEGTQKEFICGSKANRSVSTDFGEDKPNCGIGNNRACKTINYVTNEASGWIDTVISLKGNSYVVNSVQNFLNGDVAMSSDPTNYILVKSAFEDEIPEKTAFMIGSVVQMSFLHFVHSAEYERNLFISLIFIDEGGKLHLTRCTFDSGSTLEETDELLCAPLFVAKSSLIVSECNISNFHLNEHSLIEMKSFSNFVFLNVNLSYFSHIVSCKNSKAAVITKEHQNGSIGLSETHFNHILSPASYFGGALLVLLSQESQLVIEKGCSFSECESNSINGEGGAIYLSTALYPQLVISALSEFSNNSAHRGRNMFVSTSDLRTLSESMIPPKLMETYGSSNFLGKDKFSGLQKLLYFFTKYRASNIYVDSSIGCDDFSCGSKNYPCLTITHALTHFESQYYRNLALSKILFLEESLMCEEGTNLSISKYLDCTINIPMNLPILNSPEAAIENFGLTKINNVVIDFPENYAESCGCTLRSIILSNGKNADLRLSGVSFRSGGTLISRAFNVVYIGGGKFFTNNIEIDTQNSQKLHYSPLIFVSANSKFAFEARKFKANKIVACKSGLFEIYADEYSLLQCSFSRITSDIQSSICVVEESQTAIIEECTFHECGNNLNDNSVSFGGVIKVKKNSNLCVISDTKFIECFVGCEAGRGGAIYVEPGAGSLSIKSSTFISCYTHSNVLSMGGALFIGQMKQPPVLNQVSFQSCSAYCGGALFLDSSSSELTAYLFSCLFDNNKAFENGHGCDIFFIDRGHNELTRDKSPFIKCMSNSKSDERFFYEHDDIQVGRKDFISDLSIKRNVHPKKGTDDKQCGVDKENYCKTIGIAVSLCVDWTDCSIFAADKLFDTETTTINIDKKIIVIKPMEDVEKSTIVTVFKEKQSLFYINTNGNLHLQSFALEHDTSVSANLESPLFYMHEGNLLMVMCEIFTKQIQFKSEAFQKPIIQCCDSSIVIYDSSISSFTLEEHAFIGVFNSKYITLKLQNCNFSNIEKLKGEKGAVYSLSGSTISQAIEIQEVSFNGIRAFDSTKGGALSFELNSFEDYLTMRQAGGEYKPNTFEGCCSRLYSSYGGAIFLSVVHMSYNLHFTSFSAPSVTNPNSAEFGRDLFIKAENLPIFVQFAGILRETCSWIPNSVVGCDSDSIDKPVDLICLFGEMVYDLYVGNAGFDNKNCGFSLSSKCKTLEFCLRCLNNERDCSLLIDETLKINSIKFDDFFRLSILSASKVRQKALFSFSAISSLEIEDIGFVEVENQLKLSYLSFDLPQKFISVGCCNFIPKVYIVVEGKYSSLTISCCDIPIPEKESLFHFELPFVKVIGGILCIESLFICYNNSGKECARFTSNFIEIEDLYDENETIISSVSISVCTFRSTFSKGSLVSSSSSGSVGFRETFANNCSVQGACIFGAFSKGELVIEDTIMNECSCFGNNESILISVHGIDNNSPNIKLLSCSFKHIQMINNSEIASAILIVDVGELMIENCQFYNINTFGSGGALHLERIGSKSYIKNNYFYGNSAQNGGAIYILTENLNDSGTICCFFEKNVAYSRGMDVYLDDHRAEPVTESNNPFRESCTSTINESTLFHNSSLLNRTEFGWIKYAEIERKVASNASKGIDKEYCGYVNETKCDTIETAVKRTKEIAECTVALDGLVYENEKESIVVGSKRIQIKGESEKETILVSNFKKRVDSFFTVSSGSLKLKILEILLDPSYEGTRTSPVLLIDGIGTGSTVLENCTLTSDYIETSVSRPVEANLFIAKGGSLKLKNATITNLFFKNYNLISLINNFQMLSLDSTVFKDITLNGNVCCVSIDCSEDSKARIDLRNSEFSRILAKDSIEGAALFVRQAKSSISITISKTKFTKCCNKEGDGGGKGAGVCAIIDQQAENYVPMKFSSVEFADNSGCAGNNIFIRFKNSLESFNEMIRFDFDLKNYYGVRHLFEVEDANGKISDLMDRGSIMLLPYSSDSIFISDEHSSDSILCGEKSSPCSTINRAIEHAQSNAKSKISIVSKFSFHYGVVFESGIMLEAESNERVSFFINSDTKFLDSVAFRVRSNFSMSRLNILYSGFAGIMYFTFIECAGALRVVRISDVSFAPLEYRDVFIQPVFLRTKDYSTVYIENSTLYGLLKQKNVNLQLIDSERSEMCSWTQNESLIMINERAEVTLINTDIRNSSYGGILMDNGKLFVQSATFANNKKREVTNFENLRHNILCSSGELFIEKMNVGDSENSENLWISSNQKSCFLSGKEFLQHKSELFVPHLLNVSKSVSSNLQNYNGREGIEILNNNRKQKNLDIGLFIYGKSLFPCSLKCEVCHHKKDEQCIWHQSSFDVINETFAVAMAKEEDVTIAMDEDETVSRILFGNGYSTDTAVLEVKNHGNPEPRSDSPKLSRTALILIIVSSVVLVVMVITMIAFIARGIRHKKKKVKNSPRFSLLTSYPIVISQEEIECAAKPLLSVQG